MSVLGNQTGKEMVEAMRQSLPQDATEIMQMPINDFELFRHKVYRFGTHQLAKFAAMNLGECIDYVEVLLDICTLAEDFNVMFTERANRLLYNDQGFASVVYFNDPRGFQSSNYVYRELPVRRVPTGKRSIPLMISELMPYYDLFQPWLDPIPEGVRPEVYIGAQIYYKGDLIVEQSKGLWRVYSGGAYNIGNTTKDVMSLGSAWELLGFEPTKVPHKCSVIVTDDHPHMCEQLHKLKIMCMFQYSNLIMVNRAIKDIVYRKASVILPDATLYCEEEYPSIVMSDNLVYGIGKVEQRTLPLKYAIDPNIEEAVKRSAIEPRYRLRFVEGYTESVAMRKKRTDENWDTVLQPLPIEKRKKLPTVVFGENNA